MPPFPPRRLARAGITLAAALCALAAPAQAVEPTPETFHAVSGGGTQLISFTTASNTPQNQVPISGLAAGEIVVALEVRPATGELYGLTDQKRLVRIDRATGAATVLSDPLPYGGTADLDVNPAADVIRVVTTEEQNLRVNPSTGSLIAADPPINPAGNVLGVAYTNPVDGAGQTTLYDLGVGSLFRQGGFGGSPSPNTGALTTIGSHGLGFPNGGSFDISPVSGRAFGIAFSHLAGPCVAGQFCLEEIDLETGTATPLLVTVTGMTALAVAPPATTVRLAQPLYGAGEGDGPAQITVRRSGEVNVTTNVPYTLIAGSAAAGADFDATGGTVTFAPGETAKTISVPLVDDGADEPLETFSIALGAGTAAPTSATVAIFDNDPAPVSFPPDTTRPTVLVAGPTALKLKTLLNGLKLQTACSERCNVTARLFLGNTLLGTLFGFVDRAGIVAGTLRLSSAGRAAITRRMTPTPPRRGRKPKPVKPAKLRVEARGVDAAGLQGTSTMTVVVSR